MHYSGSRSVSVLLDSHQESIRVVAASNMLGIVGSSLHLMSVGLKGSCSDGHRNGLTPQNMRWGSL